MRDFLVGTSTAIRTLSEDLDLAAQSNTTVLISGESGCGTEDLARLIHLRSRSLATFRTVRCMETDKFLSEPVPLDGTIFLDEIGELNLETQARLVEWLERSRTQAASSERGTGAVGMRIIAGTCHRLIDRVENHAFRSDLYYRVNLVHLWIPPLRDRQGDIPVLMSRLLESLADVHRRPVPDLDACAEAALVGYGWPGNLCQLRAVAEGLVLGSRTGRIRVNDLPEEIARVCRA